MNTTTQTAAMTIEMAAQIATEIANANAFEYAGNYGRGTFRFAVRARVAGNEMVLSADVNACITKERAREELAKVWKALVAALMENGAAAGFTMPRRNGSYLWRQGDWHMGHFHTSGIARAIRAKQ